MESAIDGKGSELPAILYAHKTFKSLIQGKAVKLYTDSKNASAPTTGLGNFSVLRRQLRVCWNWVGP